ncbi:phosphohydrolase [Patescibacteria group bacterium]|nr:phosphohydrolase [Patescibacteria group bacterium]MCL5797852.1 phosphohydrolase [Patescibacteria group bacterium]
MNIEEARKLLHLHMQNTNLRRHCYSVAAVMRALACHFNEDEDVWEVVGLLHDGDYEEVKKDPSQHTLLMHKWLVEAGEKDERIFSAILSHNFVHTGKNPPKNKLEWSLYCCDELTGLIVAVALVRPDKKLSSVTVESVQKKWGKSEFAAGVDRNQIAKCEEILGIKLPEFIGIALSSMQSISSELGL